MKSGMILMLCRHFLPEIAALAAEEEFSGIIFKAYSAICDHPQKEREVWENSLSQEVTEDNQVIVLGVCGLKNFPLFGDEHIHIVKQTHCLYLFAPPALIDHYLELGYYILTPGWLFEWKDRFRQWKFDQEDASSFFKKSASGLFLLDTKVDPDSASRLEELGEYLDMPTQTLPLGLDFFRLFIRNLVSDRQLKQSGMKGKSSINHTGKQKTDYAMALDLMENLAQKLNEEEVIQGILNLFSMLFAPKLLVYYPMEDSHIGIPHALPPGGDDFGVLRKWLVTGDETSTWLHGKEGFLLRLTHKGKTYGGLLVSRMACPEHNQNYMNLAKSLSALCGLVVDNARLFQHIEDLANTDGLTELNNRRRFFQLASAEFSRSSRYGNILSAMMFDLDHFKQINDTYSHAAGDSVLSAVGECCRKVLRGMDICGRCGREEFTILLPETPIQQAMTIAERLRQVVADSIIEVEGQSLRVTISIGLAGMTNECKTLEDLISRCDTALHSAKSLGRNQVQVAGS